MRLRAPALALTVLAFATSARAYDKQACVDASEKAQQLRNDGKFAEARMALGTCMDGSCPGVVRAACAGWLQSIDQAQPSVVLAAQDARGQDLTDVRVSMDGAPLVERLEGRTLPVDPGEHQFRFESGGGKIEKRVVVREGEARRSISVVFAAPASATGPASPVQSTPEASRAAASSSPPVLAWIAGGVGIAAAGSFGFFAISGAAKWSDLKNSCYGHCANDQVDGVKTRFLIADISLGVAVVALGVATYLVLTHKARESSHAQVMASF
jgi:hypothetical protein